jgi:hypothetical protein
MHFRVFELDTNGSALCRCGISIPFSPELKPNKDINDNDKNQKLGYDLLPEPQPKSEPLLIGLPSATLAQNALLAVRFVSKSSFFNVSYSWLAFLLYSYSVLGFGI